MIKKSSGTLSIAQTARMGTIFILVCPWLPFSAWAQSENTAGVLEEVLVTAEKRETSIQDVAVSVTALTAETLEKFSIEDFEDYITLIPGVSSNMAGPVSNRGVRPVGLRGVQTLSGTIVNGQNTVGFYINNSPIPVSNPRLVDLQRIEVLRGPQGALYSANSMAGTIKLVTKVPSTESVFGTARVGVGATDSGGVNWEAEAAINVPLSDGVAMRAEAYYEDMDGYIDYIDVTASNEPTGMGESNANDMTAQGGRVAFRFDATDTFFADASVMYSKREIDMTTFYDVEFPGLTFRGHFPLPAYDEFTLVDLNLTWDAGPVTVVSTSSWFNSESDVFNDLTLTFGPLLFPNPGPTEVPYNPYGNENDDFSQEIRVQSNGDGPFQYIVGIFYSDREEVSATTVPAPPGKTSILGVFPWLPGQPVFMNTSPRLREETALYAEASYEFAENWTAVVGARAFEFDFTTIDHFVGSTLLAANNEILIEGEATESDVVPKFRLEYRPSDDALLFATAAEGFRMGGANFPIPTQVPSCAEQVEAIFGVPEVPGSFTSDSLWSYELGGKFTLSEGRVILNAAAFYIDWQDQQVPTGTLCQFSGAVLNVGKVVSKGLEFELHAAATENLTFALTGAYIDAEVKEDFQLPGATAQPFAFAGDPLPDIPEVSASLIGEYRFPAFDSWNGYIRGDVRYVDDRAGNIADDYTKDSFTEANLRFGIENEEWDLMLYIENLTDERPTLLRDPLGYIGTPVEHTLVPRTYGISVRRNF